MRPLRPTPAALLLAALWLASPVSAVTVDWVTVEAPGNACDPFPTTCLGAVPVPYRIARTEVTNAQYAEFLNSVAVSDPNGLFSPLMASDPDGGIVRSGSDGSYGYGVAPGREQFPVGFASFWNAARFANWLHNGQPTGPQGPGTTEDGAYTLTPAGIAGNTVTRNSDAIVFLPSRDEWHKAAYYDAISGTYFDYPAGTDTPTVCAPPGPTPNTANCGGFLYSGPPVAVGSYVGSPSPWGTYDQGGNVPEWNDDHDRSGRFIRGGGTYNGETDLRSSVWEVIDPDGGAGLRVASVPGPAPALLVLAAFVALAYGRDRSNRGGPRRAGGGRTSPVG